MEQMKPNDGELLTRYARERAESAFAELVRRHLGLVYSAALRQVDGDTHTAEDVAQTVFAELARQATRLTRHPALTGWLYTTTRQTAAHVRRAHQRRERREQESIAMQDHTPEADEWRQLKPILDEAMHELPETDRLALLCRYFEGRDLRAVGTALGVSDNAARMRVQRALETLREILGKRGVTTTTAGLAALLGSQTATALPASLAAAITSASLAATTAPAVFGLTQTTLIAMKTPILCGVTALVVSVPLLVQQSELRAARVQLAEWQTRQTTMAAAQSEHQAEAARLAALADELARLRAEETELLQLREEARRLQGQLGQAGGERVMAAESALRSAEAERQRAVAETAAKELNEQTVNAMKNLGLAARIYATDHEDRFPATFEDMKNELPPELPSGLSLDRFEFYPQPRTISEMEPQLILFREKEPRLQPDGRWMRAYTLADGSVQNATSATRDFTEWEKSNYGVASPEIPAALKNNPLYQPKK